MIIRTPHEIGLLVKDQRRKRGWSQAQFATQLGVSRLWIVQLEQGKTTAQLGLVLRALNELELPLSIDLDAVGTRRRLAPGEVDLDAVIREATGTYRT